MTLELVKHHGLGNDFLVALGGTSLDPVWRAAEAVRLCDRRRGIGADGLLFVDPAAPGTDATMVLHNADGSRAEMSGNGIRCFVHALVRSGRVSGDLVRVATDAGQREVEVFPTPEPDTIWASVSMGAVLPLAPPARWHEIGCDPMRPVAHLSLGNPHSVVAVDDVWEVELAELGAIVPEVNLEIVAPGPEPHVLVMRVHERGAGITQACGTGATAAAVAAARWGLVTPHDGEVVVAMEGGQARVRLGTEPVLIGPSVYVGAVQA
jgi:diaminopimelate epimerase